MQIPINKDIRRYQEEIFMGLTLRQLLCSGIAIGLAVLIYLWAKPLLGQETASWLCILAAAPIAAAGFLSYDGLPFEKFVIIVLESTILYSGWRVWKTELRPKQKGKVKKIAFMDAAVSIERRIAAMKQIYDAGIRTVCFVSPVFPGITDFEAIFERVKDQCDLFWLENLNLRGGFKNTVMDYIAEEYPDLVPLYDEIYNKHNRS